MKTLQKIDPEKLYTSEELTEFLRVSLRTTQRLLHSKTVNSYKVNGQYRIRGLDILNYLNNVRNEEKEFSNSENINKPENLITMLDIKPISVELGLDLIKLVDPNQGSNLLDKIEDLRRKIINDLGFICPGICLKDDINLNKNEYCIYINGIKTFSGNLNTEKFYIIPKLELRNNEIENLNYKCINPEELENIDKNNYKILNSLEVLMENIEYLIKKYSYEILSLEEVYIIVENIRKKHHIAVEEVIEDEYNTKNRLSISEFSKILKSLLRENISIQNIRLILESLATSLKSTRDLDELIELTRIDLSRQICTNLAECNNFQNKTLYVLNISENTEKVLQNIFNNKKDVILKKANSNLKEDNNIEEINIININKFISLLKKSLKTNNTDIIICNSDIRKHIRLLIEKYNLDSNVLSYKEIHSEFEVEILEEIDIK